MAIVFVNSSLFPDPRLDQFPIAPAEARGVTKTATFEVAAAATDNTGSIYTLAMLPADALWDESTSFKIDAWAFADVRIGTRASPGALVSVLRTSGVYANPVLVGDAKHGQRIWQALGLAARPENGLVEIVATAIANATIAGTLRGKLAYRDQS
jgi:hypothetical protein